MWILDLFISSVLIFSLLAPLFRRIRATFSRFGMKLKFSPQSGKTFNDNSTKRNPLSAQCATLPEGESFISRHLRATLPEGESFLSRHLRATLPEGESCYRHCMPLSPKGKAVIDTACHSPRKKKRFPPSGKAFCFPTRLLLFSAECEDFLSLRLNQNERGRLSII